jgi:hypothetical protein
LGLGKLGRGQPFVSSTKFGIPIEIDFEQPEEMSDCWINLSGGAVFVYPVIMIGITGSHLPTPWELLSPVNVVVLYLSLAASGVSCLTYLQFMNQISGSNIPIINRYHAKISCINLLKRKIDGSGI